MADYNTDIKEYIERGLAEVGDLINRREYNSSVVKARQIAGSIISGYAAERSMGTGKLADTIEALYSGGAINMTSRDDFHSLRLYGSKAVHDRDCSEEDARSAYYFLNNEVQTYLSRKNVSVDRTPVKVDRSQISPGYTTQSRSSSSAEESSDSREQGKDSRSTQGSSARRRRSTSKGVRSARRASRTGSTAARRQQASSSSGARRRQQSGGGFSGYDILKVLIPVIIFILLVIIVRSILPSDSSDLDVAPAVETTVQETEAVTEPETTTEAETEPPVYEYQIKGSNVNIRYADNQDRVYTQLSSGYVIGEVTEIEGSDFVQFTLDGVSVVVHKDYIEPVEESD